MESEFVTLCVCGHVEEAYLLRSILEANGIEVYIPDEYTQGLHYPPIAIDGVRLLVRENEIARARTVLGTIDPEE
jgi:hypothetical protein